VNTILHFSNLTEYISIDVDLLTLIDNVDIEAELKDAAEALLDESLFDRYIKEKSYLIVSKFLVREEFRKFTEIWHRYKCN
jgi:hypothetical protein